MYEENYFQLGYISRTHGLKGDVVVTFIVDPAEFYTGLKKIFVEVNGQLVPYPVRAILLKNNQAIIKLEGLTVIEQAEKMLKLSVYVEKKFLPELDQSSFYTHEIIGFKVVDKTHGEIGTVQEVLKFPHQNIFQIVDKAKNEILIPAQQNFIVKVDRENNYLYLDAPEGLIDLYLKKDAGAKELD